MTANKKHPRGCGKEKTVSNSEVKQILEKQLELLSEKSKKESNIEVLLKIAACINTIAIHIVSIPD